MAELSLNWKRLSTVILQDGTKKSSPNAKGAVKKTQKYVGGKVTKKKNASRNNETTHKKHKQALETVTKLNGTSDQHESENEKSLIAGALWNCERGLTIETIHNAPKSTKASSRKQEIGKYVALDCEFVGVGPEGTESALARVSFVNFYGHVILDVFVKPRERVTDWRTWVSGVTPQHMTDAISFDEAQKRSSEILENRILVGHAVHHDLDSLFLSHPRLKVRDTSSFTPFKSISNGRTPSLKKLIKHFLNMDIQDGSHSSVEDAQATMLLYRLHKDTFEKSIRTK